MLPEIKPYVNRNLFSDHFLRELLPEDESWAVDEDEVRLAMQAALNLYDPRREELPHLNEAQLEQEFVRPVLESLGHVFQVQPSLPTSEGVRRPDYAFFATPKDKRQARKHKGKPDYFKKAIAIGDAKQWGRPLDKRQRRGTDKFDMLSPSWQIDYYLRTSEVPWAILTDGRIWRLYNRETSFRLDVYYEIDFPQILAARDIEAFKYFYLFFRREAFIRDPEGLCFLDRVYQGSLEYAREVGDDLKESVYKALRILAEGFVETPGNNLNPSRDLETIHANALIYLYRLLFINYAEDRRLLPRDNPLYKETYGLVSMEGEIASKLERQESLSPLQATYWEKLRVLFDLINRGSEPFGIDKDTLFVPPYNGGLFDPQHHPFLEQSKVADRWLAQVMDLLARSKGEGPGKAFVDYSSLDVRHLGSIYEGLLEYKLRVADEEMVAIRRRGREEWVSASEAEGKKALERLQPSQLYLATDRGQRKATGSYYTPEYVVKYIVENTLGPLIAEKKKDENPIQAILSLKVLDPAMGSGHFLVEATDSLAHALVQALGGSEEEPEEDDIRWARREVVERCIYGVDLNPLAVELAKLSLWLHTVAEGKPLNFLDHHLKVGNSLIGAWVEDLGSLPAKRKRIRLTDSEEVSVRQMNLLEQRLNEKLPVMLGKVLEISERPTDTIEDIRGKEAADQAIRELKAPFKDVADLWVSTYFGNEVRPAEYDEALQHIGDPQQLMALPAAKRACEIAVDKRFFHWELEFPEVFYEDAVSRGNPGFDVVVGNPPYITYGGKQDVGADQQELQFYRSRFRSSEYKPNSFCMFYERFEKWNRIGGFISFIVPRTFMDNYYFRGIREQLSTGAEIQNLVQTRFDVFPEAETGGNAIGVFRTNPRPDGNHLVQIAYLDSRRQFADLPNLTTDIRQDFFASTPANRFLVSGIEKLTILEKARERSAQLGHFVHVSNGVNTGNAADILLNKRNLGPTYKPILEGKDINRFEINWGGLWIDYDPSLKSRLRPEDLKTRQKRVDFALRRPEIFENPKIIIRQTSDTLIGAFDAEGYITRHSTHLLCPKPRLQLSPLFLLALFNSTLLDFVYELLVPEKGKTFAEVKTVNVEQLPIRQIGFTTVAGERQQLVAQAEMLYADDDHAGLLGFSQARLDAKPEQADVIHDLLALLARRMIEMNKAKQAEAKGFLDWLAVYTGLPIEEWRLKTIAKAYWEHPWDELRRALRQNRKTIGKASGRNVEGREALEAIQGEFDQSVCRLTPLLEHIASTDRLIDLIVYRLYALTEEEVRIVEGA